MTGAVSASTLLYIAAGSAIVAGGVGAYGAIESGQAAGASAKYGAAVAQNNAIIADQNAQNATAAGEAQATQSQLKTAATVGAIRAAQAANGLDVNSGSAVDVQSSAKELGELDALTIRNSAARQAYGYKVQSSSFVDDAGLKTASASQAVTAGYLGAGSSILGGASSAANDYGSFLQKAGSTTSSPFVLKTGGT